MAEETGEGATAWSGARVRGEPVTQLPHDLYIPPDALEVFLESFEGPLDLLLYLIRRQNLDILDVPIAAITRQYMEYVELMKELRLELAAEYLAMAAVLAEIKSRSLLPRPPVEADPEADPRAELIRRLQEYERYKTAAEALDALPRSGRDVFPASATAPDALEVSAAPPAVELRELLSAYADVMNRAELYEHHHVQREALSVRERMSDILAGLQGGEFVAFDAVLRPAEGRAGVVVGFLAVLELVKAALVEVVQTAPLDALYLRARA